MDHFTELEDRKIGSFNACVHFEPTTQYYRAEVAQAGRVIASFDVALPVDGWAAIGHEIKRLTDKRGWMPACMANRNGSA